MDVGQVQGRPPETNEFKPKQIASPVTPTNDEKKQALVLEARKSIALMLDALEKDQRATTPKESTNLARTSLKAFLASDAVTAEKFRTSGGIRLLALTIQKHSQSSDVVHHACSALAAFTLHDRSIVGDLVKAGCINSIISAIRAQAQRGNEDARVSALKVLRNLTQDEQNREQIYKSSGIQAICDMINNQDIGERALSHSALVLSNLTFANSQMKEEVGRLGGLAMIAKGMLKHPDHQAVQARGSLALRNLCFQSEYNQSIAAEAQVPKALLAAIDKYIDDREVVHQSCVALANISNISEQNREKIVKAGGSPTIVKLMQLYPDSQSATDDALSILRNIAVGSSAAQLEVGVKGGVACVCHALHKFGKNPKIADKACTALRYLCFLPDNRVRVRDCKGIEGLVNALNSNMSNVGIVENALLAIGNATFESEDNKSLVGKCGGIATIIEAVGRHRLAEPIQEHGCRVLRNLSDGFEYNRMIAAEKGAIKTGMFAMLGYPENPSVQEQAAAMLLNLTLSDENIDQMRDTDIERLAEKALKLHQKHRGVQLQAGSLLDRLHGHDISSSGGGDASDNSQDRISRGSSRRGFISRFLPARGNRD